MAHKLTIKRIAAAAKQNVYLYIDTQADESKHNFIYIQSKSRQNAFTLLQVTYKQQLVK